MNITVSMLDRLNTQHLSLSTIISGLGDEQLSIHQIPGKWNIKENIAHLARYQVVFTERLNKILTTECPAFDAYQAEKDIEFEKWLRKNPAQLQEEILGDRKAVVGQLTTLTERDLQRVGVHPKFGKLTILEWTEFFLLHEAHHLFTIFRLAHTI